MQSQPNIKADLSSPINCSTQMESEMKTFALFENQWSLRIEGFGFWFGLMLYAPVNNFSVMSGRSHCFLGITSTFGEVNVSCSRIQHGDPSDDRTPALSLRSPTLYH